VTQPAIETSQVPAETVIAALGSAAAALLSLCVAVLVPYLQWRGSDGWRRWRAQRLVGIVPSDVRRWSLRFNVVDAWKRFDRHRRRDTRVVRKLEQLYKCPRLPPCEYPQFCETCEAAGGRRDEFLYWLKRRGDRWAQRQQTFLRRQLNDRPWRLNWRPRPRRQPAARARETIADADSPTGEPQP